MVATLWAHLLALGYAAFGPQWSGLTASHRRRDTLTIDDQGGARLFHDFCLRGLKPLGGRIWHKVLSDDRLCWRQMMVLLHFPRLNIVVVVICACGRCKKTA